MMIAYYVRKEENNTDHIVVPQMGCAVDVDAERLEEFIAPSPVFAKWSGDSCSADPQEFGSVIATREEGGDVCVLDSALWQEILTCHLGDLKPDSLPNS